MRVLLLSPLPPPIGGIATWTGQIISENLRQSLVDLHVVNTAIKGRSLTGASILSRIFYGLKQAIEVFCVLLIKLLRLNPDVVHVCSSGDYGLLRDTLYIIFLRIFGFKVVLHLHRGKVPDYKEMFARGGFEKYVAVLACRIASGVIVLNRDAFETLSQYSSNIEIIENFVGVDKFDAENKYYRDGCKTILFVGHVIERKGVFVLLDAAIDLKAQGALDKLIFVGPCSDDVRRLLLRRVPDALGLEWVEFSGPCSPAQVETALVECSVFCLPSYAEGLPFALLEAMAIGVPIVSTSVSGIPNVLADGAGVCVPPGDVDALSRGLRSLLMDPSTASTIGQRARLRCRENYSGDLAFQKLVNFWKK